MKQCLFFVLACLLFATTATAQTDTLIMNGEKGGLELNKRIPLKRGEIVTFETIREINSDNVQIGDVIPLRVAKPVLSEGYKLIHQGAYGEAIVRDVKKARGFGRAGSIVLEVINVETFDGHRVKINAQSLLIAEGHNRKGLAWAVSIGGLVVVGTTSAVTLGASGVFLGVPCVTLGGLVRGQEAVIKQGKILSGTVKETTEVGADPNSTNQVFFKN